MSRKTLLPVVAFLLLPAAASVETLPFFGTLQGQITSLIPDPPIAVVEASGGGQATHVGNYQFSFPHLVNFNNLTAEGHLIVLAADGSSFTLEVTGTFAPTAQPFVLDVTVSGPIISGTGRFDQSSGNLSVNAQVNLATGTSNGWWAGNITLH